LGREDRSRCAKTFITNENDGVKGLVKVVGKRDFRTQTPVLNEKPFS
jgi:hypothetical protein